ncbi:MAG: hypothetical protein IT382_02430 [Deltaproteobacteria bacterium]|nr:hypothetical protein [Deltaproteobacteria bacterium]
MQILDGEQHPSADPPGGFEVAARERHAEGAEREAKGARSLGSAHERACTPGVGCARRERGQHVTPGEELRAVVLVLRTHVRVEPRGAERARQRGQHLGARQERGGRECRACGGAEQARDVAGRELTAEQHGEVRYGERVDRRHGEQVEFRGRSPRRKR